MSEHHRPDQDGRDLHAWPGEPVTRQTLRFCVVGGLICINAGCGGSGRFGRGDIDPQCAEQPRSAVMAHKRTLPRRR